MRKIITLLLSATVGTLVLTSCGEASEKGSLAAHQLQAAWGNPEAIMKAASDFKAVSDSLGKPESMSDAFIDACSGNDSMKVVAQAIALTPQALGSDMGEAIVDGLASGDIEAAKALEQIDLVGFAYALLQRNDDAVACFKAIDEVAQSLPEEKQMVVYAHSCAPDKLANAMRQERAQGNAGDVDRRAKMVEDILTGDDLNKFKAIYYGK